MNNKSKGHYSALTYKLKYHCYGLPGGGWANKRRAIQENHLKSHLDLSFTHTPTKVQFKTREHTEEEIKQPGPIHTQFLNGKHKRYDLNHQKRITTELLLHQIHLLKQANDQWL